jgi:protease-4
MAEPENWERAALERLAGAALIEQRRARRWNIALRLLTLAFFFLVFAALMGWLEPSDSSSGAHTAVVEIDGVIDYGGKASAENIITGLQAAFKDKQTKGVVLRINSPGGSAVQSGQVYDEIKRLRAKHQDIPIYAVVEDLCASGGYYIAAATDRIYVDKASLVGSIGVLIEGFGFTGTLDKLGIERRLITAGENKGFLDMFSPLDPKQREFAQELVNEIHKQFISVVKQGRGERLKEAPELFSGLVWNGERAVELGLADGFGSLDSVAREIVKAEDIVDYTPKENIAERFARRFGTSFGHALGKVLAPSGVRYR